MTDNTTFTFDDLPVIKGFPELRWTGKRAYNSTQYFPAQMKESYGKSSDEGWMNKIFWGDNLQVMSHMLRDYRGKIELIYIDPPFDSKADYKKKIEIKGIGKAESDSSSFEEKQYGDIWSNDEYLQFMYERLILLRELLSDTGTIYLHCDWHKSHHLRLIMDEVFGMDNFKNEIIWAYKSPSPTKDTFPAKHDTILRYSKTQDNKINSDEIRVPYDQATLNRRKYAETSKGGIGFSGKDFNEYLKGMVPCDWWNDIPFAEGDFWNDIPSGGQISRNELMGYPTQKPEKLLERIIKASTKPSDIVFDCFMGSGTTLAVAMKLGRRFLGADINLGSIQTTTKRLLSISSELGDDSSKFTGFEVYNVNNYDFFRNPIEAKELLIKALEIEPYASSDIWDGELDGRNVKIMPTNRIATKVDAQAITANLPYKTYEEIKSKDPKAVVERMTIVCMGHEPDFKASIEKELSSYKVDIEVVDILRDKKDLVFKRDSEAEIVREGNKLIIRNFFPMNLLQKLSMQKESVEDWRQLVESVMIDFNYDGAVMQPTITDIPDKKGLVQGIYDIPEDASGIKVKITDLLSESYEKEL